MLTAGMVVCSAHRNCSPVSVALRQRSASMYAHYSHQQHSGYDDGPVAAHLSCTSETAVLQHYANREPNVNDIAKPTQMYPDALGSSRTSPPGGRRMEQSVERGALCYRRFQCNIKRSCGRKAVRVTLRNRPALQVQLPNGELYKVPEIR